MCHGLIKNTWFLNCSTISN